MSTRTYAVEGMTCGHCAAAVTRELSQVPDVGDVVVDVAAGTVALTAAPSVTDDAIGAAIDEAGYTLTARV